MTRDATFDVTDLREHGETGSFRALLYADPEAAFARFAALYASRDVDRPVTENAALCGAADVISKDVMSVCSTGIDGRVSWEGNAGHVPDGFGKDLWESIMSSELPLLLAGIVSDPRFYEENDRWIFSILNCLAGLLWFWYERVDPAVHAGTLQKSRTQRFIVASLPMWETLWRCQDQLLFSTIDATGTKSMTPWPFQMLSTMTICMNGVYRGSKHFREAMLSKMPHVVLFAWYHLPIYGPADNKVLEVVAVHCMGSMHLGPRDGTKPDLVLFREDFLHGPGKPILVLKKLIHLIQTEDWMIGNELGMAFCVLANLISADYELLATYHGTPAMALLNQALRRHRKLGDRDDDSWVWSNAARNVDVVGEHLLKQLCPPRAVRGKDVFYIFARGISTFLYELQKDEPENMEQSKIAVNTFTFWCKAVNLAIKGSEGGFPSSVVEDLKAAAPTRWYPTMKKLRDAHIPVKKLVTYRKLVDNWQMLGKDLGVDEKAEGKRYEKDKKDTTKLCSWKQCEYHTSPASDDVAIKQCKGCGEARYCSRECQTTHWKKGHKVDCRRLKA
ncbi:unnamed protein product [Peniophora sp. CBMAI 1063]|nr:unnamed protein product [Peniophora sp. CBMAI 1063]